jgi:hypothetical protein
MGFPIGFAMRKPLFLPLFLFISIVSCQLSVVGRKAAANQSNVGQPRSEQWATDHRQKRCAHRFFVEFAWMEPGGLLVRCRTMAHGA